MALDIGLFIDELVAQFEAKTQGFMQDLGDENIERIRSGFVDAVGSTHQIWVEGGVSPITGIDHEGLDIASVSEWVYTTSTDDADPGAGRFRLNNSDPTMATEAYVDAVTDGGSNVGGILPNLIGGGDYLAIQQSDDADRTVTYIVQSDITLVGSAVDGYFRIPIAFDSAGADPTFQNNRACSFVTRDGPAVLMAQTISRSFRIPPGYTALMYNATILDGVEVDAPAGTEILVL